MSTQIARGLACATAPIGFPSDALTSLGGSGPRRRVGAPGAFLGFVFGIPQPLTAHRTRDGRKSLDVCAAERASGDSGQAHPLALVTLDQRITLGASPSELALMGCTPRAWSARGDQVVSTWTVCRWPNLSMSGWVSGVSSSGNAGDSMGARLALRGRVMAIPFASAPLPRCETASRQIF
jgi:hypothetical protein